jgi:hypothetical protein
MPKTPKFNVGKEKLTAQCEACELPVTPFNVKVRACVFFDGTLNNKFNVNRAQQQRAQARVVEVDSSDDADLSNVARLSNAFQFYKKKYQIQFALYIVGAGTGGDNQDVTAWGKGISNDAKGDGENRANDIGRTADNIPGKGFGQGQSGIENRVTQAYNRIVSEIARRIRVFRKKKKFAQTAPAVIESVELDAFGFSRGAAKARHFVSKVLEGWREGFFGGGTPHNLSLDLGRIQHVQSVGEVKFVFLGLYDTVSSFGYDLNFDDDVRQLRLDLMNRVDRVVHLCAADEHRKNFSLTDITSAGGKGVEIFLPGVHSDLGGGYLAGRGDAGTWVYYNPVPYRMLKRRGAKILRRAAGFRIRHWFVCPGGAHHTWSETYDYAIGTTPYLKFSVCPTGLETRENQRDILASWQDEYDEWPDEWHEFDSWKNRVRQLYDNERLWLEKSGWFPSWLQFMEEDRSFTSLPLIYAKGFTSTRGRILNRYSWVALQLMADFASDPRWFMKFGRESIYGQYSLSGDPFLRNVQKALYGYIAQKCGPVPKSKGVGKSVWQDWFSHPTPCDKAAQYPWLAELRRDYCHFSAFYQDGTDYWIGAHVPRYVGGSRQRRIHRG